MKYHALSVIFEKAAKFELLQIVGGALKVDPGLHCLLIQTRSSENECNITFDCSIYIQWVILTLLFVTLWIIP